MRPICSSSARARSDCCPCSATLASTTAASVMRRTFTIAPRLVAHGGIHFLPWVRLLSRLRARKRCGASARQAMRLTRSQFFKVVVGGSAWLVSSGFAQRIRNAVADAARPLPLTSVRLTGGPLKHAQELDAKYLLALEPDRMLAPYRQLAGLEAKGEPLAG